MTTPGWRESLDRCVHSGGVQAVVMGTGEKQNT